MEAKWQLQYKVPSMMCAEWCPGVVRAFQEVIKQAYEGRGVRQKSSPGQVIPKQPWRMNRYLSIGRWWFWQSFYFHNFIPWTNCRKVKKPWDRAIFNEHCSSDIKSWFVLEKLHLILIHIRIIFKLSTILFFTYLHTPLTGQTGKQNKKTCHKLCLKVVVGSLENQ